MGRGGSGRWWSARPAGTVAPGATADQDILETDLATELIEYCRPKLAGFKRPRSVVFVNSLPRNVMGKLLKRELREQYGYPMDSSS